MGYVLGFGKIDRTQGTVVGGKGANLGELSRVDGIRVPDGFCVTTDAYRRATATIPMLDGMLDRLSRIEPGNLASVRSLSAEIRSVIEKGSVPDDVAAEILRACVQLGESPCAVRSSATAEDLPSASFAGQHDSYLNVQGGESILRHFSRCWASLFTERAVVYRQRNGLDHRAVDMAVVVQRMVDARASGIMFTADPVTSNRKVVSIDAGSGLGDALVSGLVDADTYKVRGDEITDRAVRGEAVLTESQTVRLAQVGRKIEAHFGSPQDIEWCFEGDDFHIVQSRPITTLFPIPEADDDENRVYVSVGHQQMMTDAMKPLGISVWQATSPASMRHAGARLFVDVTAALAHPSTRGGMVGALAKSDPLVGDALRTVLDRDFIVAIEDGGLADAPKLATPEDIDTDPRTVEELIAYSDESNVTASREIRTRQGSALLDFIVEDILELRRLLFHPKSLPAIMAGVDTAEWLNARLQEWLGEKNAADILAQSVSHNVTSEMGLALLDVADAMRPHPEVVDFLRHATDDDAGFLDRLEALDGGREARAALESYLGKYGMRCVGEIDITRVRWSEQPAILAPVIVSNIDIFAPGEAARRFDKGLREAQAKERELLERLRELPDGEQKADETKRMIDRLRTFAGYREYPKYAMIGRYFEYKKALLGEGQRLVDSGVLVEKEDIFYLRLDELREMVRTQEPCDDLVRQRKDEFDSYRTLSAPRILTSEGEALAGAYRRDDLPSGALPGTAVSTGIIEGRARVIVDMSQADLGADDILVTRFTDPSWTPLFVTVKGLVTEVGGLMTHGAVIAREYGLPAVVGVENATRSIRDGQRIRVNGTDGYVEILP